MLLNRTLLLFFLVALTAALNGQPKNIKSYSSKIDEEKLKSVLSFISDDLTEGRAAGSPGSLIVSSYLKSQFEKFNMIPFYSTTFTKSFQLPPNGEEEQLIGRNIIGVVPSLYYTDRYLLVTAHYDHLGVLEGRIYNGADDNASGVTSLLTLASLFSEMRSKREGPRVNIIFALFDAKEIDLAGSSFFAKKLPISPQKIKYAVNIDQVGSTFAPPGQNSNYLLYVADLKIRAKIINLLDEIKKRNKLDIDIDHTFYGSKPFYEVFLKISDNYNLTKAGIPSIMFTSGIHMHTYKPTDEHYFIDYKALKERIELIFLLINKLMEN